MKTQEEIVQYIRKNSGLLDFTADALVPYLDFEHAKPYLKEGATAEEWEEARVELTDEAVKSELAEYMSFAWGKVEDHRGISASRSVDKCTAWAWLLNGDEAVEEVEAAGYAQYGAPKLAVICRRFGLPIPESDEIKRMIQGQPCGAGQCGCGE